jgi:hypothetical protein
MRKIRSGSADEHQTRSAQLRLEMGYRLPAIGHRTRMLSEPSPNDLDGVAGSAVGRQTVCAVPSSVKLMPHRHPEDRVYTVVSGVFYIGLGSVFDEERLQAYPPGAVVVPPGDTRISTGRNPEPTSPKYRPSDRSASNTSTRSTIPGMSEQGLVFRWPSRGTSRGWHRLEPVHRSAHNRYRCRSHERRFEATS